ncbi:hypothetical protein HUJ05_001836 [Dendroctonus ponderosae]|nr:hypothetical protein HUJ05_001836 [Dendroctonus ponderosae]
MQCTGLDKVTTKTLILEKYNHLRFFCALCDSPNLRYLNDKVTNLSKNQVPQGIIDSLVNQISKLSSSVPTVSEIYDIMLSLESKWGILEGKLDDIRRVTELFTTCKPDMLLRSMRDMEQNLFSISQVLLGNDEDNISIQVHDSSSADLKMGMEGLRDGLANVAAMVRHRDKDSEESTFQVGTLTRESAERLLGHSMWPRGVRVECSTESGVSQRVVEDRRLPTGGARVSVGPGLEGLLAAAPADYGDSRPRSVITITSDKLAIAACRTNSFANVKLPEGMPRDEAPSLDPLTPPIVKMTVASDRSKDLGRRYLIARLREPSILKAIRLYLAYLHDQPASVCYEGFTTTSIIPSIPSI